MDARAGQRARQQVEQQVESVAFMAAERHDGAGGICKEGVRIVGGVSVCVDDARIREARSLVACDTNFADGDFRRGDIDDDRVTTSNGYARCHWIRGHSSITSPERGDL